MPWQSARTEGLISRAEALTAALDSLGHRLADAQSLAAAQCESVSLQDKVHRLRGFLAYLPPAWQRAVIHIDFQ